MIASSMSMLRLCVFWAWEVPWRLRVTQALRVQELADPEVIHWAENEVRLERDGSMMRLVHGRNLVVEMGWANAHAVAPSLVADDEVEHSLTVAAGRLLQRAAINDGWRNRWVLVRDHDGAAEVNERLRVCPGPEYTLWSWASGVSAILAIAPRHEPGPVLAFRLEQGYLEQARQPGASARWVEYRVTPPGTVLETGERMVTVLSGKWYPDVHAFEERLPGWMLDTQLDDGVTWWGDLADSGLAVPDGLELGFFDGQVSVDAPVGRHVIEITDARGLSKVPLEWVPQLEQVLHQLVNRVLGEDRTPTAAEAFCIQLAADRRAVWLDPKAHDLLDQLDPLSDDSLFGPAFALVRGRALGEAAVVSDALRLLSRRPVGVGYGRVVMAAFLASVSVGMDAQARCLELLARPAVGRTAALESSLLHYRSADFGARELGGLLNRLGGLLPGEAPLTSWAESAALVGLLELCPPEWAEATRCAHVAAKVRGSILCAYLDQRIVEAEPLAWLLLTPELSPAA